MTRPALAVPAPQHDLFMFSSVGDHPRDVPRVLAQAAAADLTYRFAAARTFPGWQRAVDVLPEEADIVVSHDSRELSSTWATCGDGALLISGNLGSTEIVAFSNSAASAASLLQSAASRCREPADEKVQACLWLLGQQGPTRRVRAFETPPWEDVVANYPPTTAKRLTALRQAGPPTGTARLLLWHGPPGTGKTSAVLALLHAWREWCGVDVIADPERMFLDAGYLLEVLTQPTFSKPWRMIVCEDADEYLRSDARQRSGPGLGRLLNASDGLLGRGSKSMILLTTNDELGRLHPAVTRPGRCFSLVEFGAFSMAAASEWLGRPVVRSMSLAELYEAQRGGHAEPEALVRVGAYL